MKTSTIAIAFLLLGGSMLAFASSASAQGVSPVTIQLSCTGGPSEIQPLGAPGSWNCQANPSVGGGITDPVTFLTINLQATDAPSWANVIIAPSALSFTYSPQDQGYPSVPFSVSIALTQNAPAFQSTKVTLSGQATGSQAQDISVLTTQLTVTPGYFNLYNVRVDNKIGQGGPQDSVVYPIQIDNFSNGETRFEFSLAQEDTPAGFQAVIPEPIVLQSQATGGETTSGQVTFSVYTPYQNGYVNEVGSIQLRVDSSYAPNTNIQGASSQVSTLTQARGFYVPGPATPLVAIGILGAALGLARWRREDDL